MLSKRWDEVGGAKGRHPSVGIFLTGKQDVELILAGFLISGMESLIMVKDLIIIFRCTVSQI